MKALLKEVNSKKSELIEGEGLYLPDSKLMIGGVFVHDVNGEDEKKDKNIVVNEGLIYIINTSFAAVAQQASWFIGIYGTSITPVPTHDASTFAGAAGLAGELNVQYNPGTRPAYVLDTTTLSNVFNSGTPATFTMVSPDTVEGALLIADSNKSGNTGPMAAAARFSAARVLVASDVLNVSYQLTIADA